LLFIVRLSMWHVHFYSVNINCTEFFTLIMTCLAGAIKWHFSKIVLFNFMFIAIISKSLLLHCFLSSYTVSYLVYSAQVFIWSVQLFCFHVMCDNRRLC